MDAKDQQIVDLEHAFWKTMQTRDVDVALALTDDEMLVTGAQGASKINRDAFAKMMKAGKWKLLRYEFRDVVVRRVGEDVATIAYKVREELTVEDQPVTMEAADSSTWIRRDGKWRCAVHTESVLGDPFGRDRVGPASTASAIGEQAAVANLAVKDLAKARQFYEGTVGLTPVHQEGDDVIVYKSGSSTVNVYRSDYAGTNRATAVSWSVSKIDSVVADLKEKGVRFEHYDLPGLKLEGDIHVGGHMKVAWFKDPDGNILNLSSEQ